MNMKQFLNVHSQNRYLLIFFAVLFISPVKTYAQDSTATPYTNNTIVLPALGSSPETGFLFGGVGFHQFKMGDPQSDTRTSSIVAAGIYTLNNQASLVLKPSLILENESWILNGMYGYSYFPEAFWGVGSSLDNDNEMKLINRQIFLSQSALLQVLPKLFVGPQVRWTKNYNMRFETPDGDKINAPAYTGTEDYSVTSLGFTLLWDARDRIMFPTKNHLLQLDIMTNPSGLSTIDSYTTYMLDARKYHDLSNDGSSVLAFQFITKLTSGKPPIHDLAMLGGESILRGYYEGRLRDRHGAQIQGELRQQIWGRIGVAVFASGGQVWDSFDNMSLENVHLSAGGGLRFNLNKDDPTNIRVDYGIGKNTTGLYITVGEAF